MRAIGRYAQTSEFEDSVRRGFAFYRAHFFREDGAAKYFHNRTYPIDIHAVAQTIITLTEFQDLDPASLPLADKVLQWAMDHMWDERGFFYYRVLRLATIRVSYMRWSQAWMLLALATRWSEPNGSAARSGVDGANSGAPALVSNFLSGIWSMIKCIFTIDYEIYGNGTGALNELVYEPTERCCSVFEKWGARFVNYVEVAEFERIEAAGTDAAIGLVNQQVKEMHRRGPRNRAASASPVV